MWDLERTGGVLTPGDTLEFSWKTLLHHPGLLRCVGCSLYSECPRPLCCFTCFVPSPRHCLCLSSPPLLFFSLLLSCLLISSLSSDDLFSLSSSCSLDSYSHSLIGFLAFTFPKFILLIAVIEIFVKTKWFCHSPCGLQREKLLCASSGHLHLKLHLLSIIY